MARPTMREPTDVKAMAIMPAAVREAAQQIARREKRSLQVQLGLLIAEAIEARVKIAQAQSISPLTSE